MATFLGIDYPTLWFLVVGALFSGYAILDGFDLGAGAWHLFFRKEESRRIALNAVGPVWDGNEVWLVIGGGALFAGFPVLYASMFSAMYIPFMLFLAFLIFRAVSIEFRSKEEMKWWRDFWDISYSVASVMMALLLGVVVGNILWGVELGPNYEFQGNWIDFLNPYALLVGVTAVALFMMHGAIYLAMKTEGKLFVKVNRLLNRSIIFFIVMYSIVTLFTLIYLPHLTDRLHENIALFVVPLLAFLSIANVPRLVSKGKYVMAFIFSSLTMSFLLILVALELYPVIIMSTIDPMYDITVYNAASSENSLRIMLNITAIGGPLVILYTVFVYKTFWGKVKLDETSY
ncbi:MAG: cytochrome d ubiquinol oxidase subunit II [Bacteroidetes bacterium]|jgi:cytochrome d ubiquinol oxidase subunit II|nr:cytochrome d ubiquinol oxidase subunit II [Bacteroidota bacterium]MBU1578679.1 cytochrome d ubiquinol oxidase subunit II [Bacteroidota bacterium]MBU2464866.1 cytochrome d ubiquinol oxidase subunit II [Bacteroidota bacterium]MBU2558427.1 cytochrome d ubiquinol oxidase subunit II [Bacteroidota bacterium]MDA3942504.1 cytochrome d ubiquinol oxidase subunit II [Bacteroidota bacterium]